MLVKLGVDVSRLNREIRRTLNIVDAIHRQHGTEAVITSTYEGDHSPSSLHYCNDAYDIRKPSVMFEYILTGIKKTLGDKFDVVKEKECIHIEYDPKE